MDPRKSTVYRLESRPKEQGRGVLVRVAASGDYDLTDPKKWNVRTGVHAYGGAAATVFDGTAYFSNSSLNDKMDGKVYKVVDDGKGQGTPTAITPGKPFGWKFCQVDADLITRPENDRHYFAGLAVYPKEPKFIVAIIEDHTDDPKGDQPKKVLNELCVIDEKAKRMNIIVRAEDPTQEFYGPPAFSPTGAYLAWQNWSHPYMPWDQAKIYIAEVDTSFSFMLVHVRAVPFPFQDAPLVSLAYPNWSNDNTVIFTSDVSDFLNPWKYDVSTPNVPPSAVFSEKVDRDFGCPMWSLHFFPFAVLDETRALFIGTEDGHDSLYFVDLKTPGLPKKINTGCVVIDGLRSLGKGNDGKFKVVFAGTKVDEETKLINLTVSDSLDGPPCASVTDFVSAEKDWISTPTTHAIKGNDGPVHVVYYAPKNPNYLGLCNEKPPCMVHVHGGPEWLQPQGLDWTKQYFTSRGYAWYVYHYCFLTGRIELMNISLGWT